MSVEGPGVGLYLSQQRHASSPPLPFHSEACKYNSLVSSSGAGVLLGGLGCSVPAGIHSRPERWLLNYTLSCFHCGNVHVSPCAVSLPASVGAPGSKGYWAAWMIGTWTGGA